MSINTENVKKHLQNWGTAAKHYASEAADYIFSKGCRIIDWVIDNPEAAAAIVVPITVNGLRSAQSMIVSHREKKKAERVDYTWYDRSTGLRWDLKRKMTNNDRQAIMEMKARGMSTIEILNTLRLI